MEKSEMAVAPGTSTRTTSPSTTVSNCSAGMEATTAPETPPTNSANFGVPRSSRSTPTKEQTSKTPGPQPERSTVRVPPLAASSGSEPSRSSLMMRRFPKSGAKRSPSSPEQSTDVPPPHVPSKIIAAFADPGRDPDPPLDNADTVIVHVPSVPETSVTPLPGEMVETICPSERPSKSRTAVAEHARGQFAKLSNTWACVVAAAARSVTAKSIFS
mmetsp:Transcript_1322/g.4018  ORF Transcript_1322/g.4018 Transcript_1322/m.4018 type:complete len:215 (+) Transcript_1322:673-1317(+)